MIVIFLEARRRHFSKCRIARPASAGSEFTQHKRPKSYERAWSGPKKWCINYIVHHLVWGQLPTQKDGKYPWPFLLGHLLHRVVKIKKDKSYWWGGWGVWSANSLSQVYNKCIRQIELCREKSFGAAAKASIKTSSIQWKSKTSK